MIIYKATNKINNKCYIGQTIKSLKIRSCEHINQSKKQDNYYFHNSLNKYGSENFIWEILEECDNREKMNEREKFYINFFNSFGEKGYNLNEGGGGNIGLKMSNETKIKMSNSRKGKICGDETRKKISESNKGKKLSDEHKKKLSISLKNNNLGSKKTNETKIKMSISQIGNKKMLGKIQSEETKSKIKNSLQGKKHSDERKLNISKGRSGIIPIKKECQYCKRMYDSGNYAKYHGDNCKNKLKI